MSRANKLLPLILLGCSGAVQAKQADICVKASVGSDDTVTGKNNDAMVQVGSLLANDLLPGMTQYYTYGIADSDQCSITLWFVFTKPSVSTWSAEAKLGRPQSFKTLLTAQIPFLPNSAAERGEYLPSRTWTNIIRGPFRRALFSELNEERKKNMFKELVDVAKTNPIQEHCGDLELLVTSSPSHGRCSVLPLPWDSRKYLARSVFHITAFLPDKGRIELISEGTSYCAPYFEGKVEKYFGIAVTHKKMKVQDDDLLALSKEAVVPMAWQNTAFSLDEFVNPEAEQCPPPARRSLPPKGEVPRQ